MRYLLIAALLALAADLAAAPLPPLRPQPARAHLEAQGGRVRPERPATSRAVFTLTNRGAKPLPARGWAVYYTALHDAERRARVSGGFRIESVTGSLQRIVPGPEFQGLAPGQSVEVEYRTGLLTNNSFAPNGVYVVFDDAPEKAAPGRRTRAVPFEREPQPGKDPHVITPEAQFELDSVRARRARRVAAARLPDAGVGREARGPPRRSRALPAITRGSRAAERGRARRRRT